MPSEQDTGSNLNGEMVSDCDQPTTNNSSAPSVADLDDTKASLSSEVTKPPTDCDSPVLTLSHAPEMSKRQRKRLLRHEAYLAQRPEKRRAERERRKQRKRDRLENSVSADQSKTADKTSVSAPSGVSTDSIDGVSASFVSCNSPVSKPISPRTALTPIDISTTNGGTSPSVGSTVPAVSPSTPVADIVLDLSFAHLMSERDMAKCMKQIQRCYALNRRARATRSAQLFHLHVTSLNERCCAVLERNRGWRNWSVQFHHTDYLQVFDHDRIIYLTSESDTLLDNIEPDHVYIIGALVDHNHHKGVTFSAAKRAGVRHARLPIGEHVRMCTRHVLTVDAVMAILLARASGVCGSWQEILCSVLPARCKAVPIFSGATGAAVVPEI